MVMIVTLKIKNDNDFAVKDVVVNCETVGASGTKLSEQSETIFRTFPAHSKKLVRNMNFGFIHQQSARASCELVSATAL